ncbi:unnamed protein product [Vicia faba]|uniref:Uncharacterized protein n=1 Tax=Vicia faba TaxID=3906 RepID=A0AAV1AQE2_VICFA|nr:unnamed protein product [Vicia faba]
MAQKVIIIPTLSIWAEIHFPLFLLTIEKKNRVEHEELKTPDRRSLLPRPHTDFLLRRSSAQPEFDFSVYRLFFSLRRAVIYFRRSLVKGFLEKAVVSAQESQAYGWRKL